MFSPPRSPRTLEGSPYVLVARLNIFSTVLALLSEWVRRAVICVRGDQYSTDDRPTPSLTNRE